MTKTVNRNMRGQARRVTARAEPQGASLGCVHHVIEKFSRPPSAFEQRLYQVCRKIPAGKVSTYGTLAKVLNSAPRAVGQALRRNPYAPEVPCHRVIASSLELGGFSGSWGEDTVQVKRKKALLQSEGVHFEGSKLKGSAAVLMTLADF